MNLIEWYVKAKSGRPLAESLAELSEVSGIEVDHSLLSKWRRRKRTPPPAALQYMAWVAAPTILSEFGLEVRDDNIARVIALAFTPPIRE